MSEWIEHNGTEMPVPAETKVYVRFSNDEDDAKFYPSRASFWDWGNYGNIRIVAYKIVKDEE